MKNKQAIVIFAALAIIILAGGYLFYQQNKILALLEANSSGDVPSTGINGGNKNPETMGSVPAPVLFNQAEEIKKDLTKRVNEIYGTVKQISGSDFTVEAQIVDLSKLDDFDFSSRQTLPEVIKTYKVKIDEKTSFSGITAAELKVGQKVRVIVNEKIYITDKLNAVSVQSQASLRTVAPVSPVQ